MYCHKNLNLPNKSFFVICFIFFAISKCKSGLIAFRGGESLTPYHSLGLYERINNIKKILKWRKSVHFLYINSKLQIIIYTHVTFNYKGFNALEFAVAV